jgi:hypothetical protein
MDKSDGCGSNFLACDLLLGAEPIFLLVTVLPAACLTTSLKAKEQSEFRDRAENLQPTPYGTAH